MKPPPHDIEAEEAVLGRMILRPDVIPDVCQTLTASDFYKPTHQAVFVELVNAYNAGEPLDAVALSVVCRDSVDVAWLTTVVAHAPAGHERLVRELVGLRIRRDLLFAAADVEVTARDLTVDAFDALDAASTRLAAVDAPAENVRDLWYLEEFINAPVSRSPWVIDGMFREGWRAIVVAGEGRGKSWLSRQIAVAAASGIHPLAVNHRIDPVTTLIVDLENPADSIADPVKRMRAAAGDLYSPERMFIWHRPQGIDLRKRSDRAQLEGVLARSRPKFVTLGPLYKAFTVKARESDEQAAAEVQTVLDDLRVRYGFALLMEHHAPKGQGGTRDLIPFGSSLWLRWPELGLKLVPSDVRGTLNLERWRVDRMTNAWPNRIAQGTTWPWIGEWDRNYGEVLASVP